MPIFTGDSSNNTLNGTAGDDELYGYAGDDILFGGDGNDIDWLVGGLGNDTLKGSRGKDLFFFQDPNLSIYKDASNNYHVFSFEGHDVITNYSEVEGDRVIVLGYGVINVVGSDGFNIGGPDGSGIGGLPIPPTGIVFIV